MIELLEKSWKELLSDEIEKDYFKELSAKVEELYATNCEHVFPKRSDLFRALNECPVDKVKVVIIGQDPYPTKGHANGMSFSINPDVRPFAKSLVNIFKEIESDMGKPFPETGDLTRWAKQGVLLLNTILTVEEGKPLSHKSLGWEKFTQQLLIKLVAKKEHLVVILWGSKAEGKVKDLNMKNHLVLTSVHPSPLSAYRGFFGCKHFSQANTYLKLHEQVGIDW